MYGQCKSTLVCPDCNKVSVTYDPVLSFTVIIPNSDVKKITVHIVMNDFCVPVMKQYITVKGNWPVSKIKKMLFSHLNTNFFLAIYDKNLFLGLAKDESEISEYFFKTIYAYEDLQENGYVVPVLITRAGEKGYFTGKEKKTISLPKLIKLSLNNSPEDMQKLISARFSSLIMINKDLSPCYTVNIVNTSKVSNGIIFSSKQPCDFCKKKCSNCPLGFDNQITLKNMLESRVNSVGFFLLEVEWNINAKGLNVFNIFSDEKTQISEAFVQNSTVTLKKCLERSSTAEKLDENNKWYCSQCEGHVRAVKTYQMFKAPKYLILHLMRFKSKHLFSEKNSTFVDFPVEGLDISDIVLSQHKPALYDLYAVSNHFGGLGGGHYTAFIKHANS